MGFMQTMAGSGAGRVGAGRQIAGGGMRRTETSSTQQGAGGGAPFNARSDVDQMGRYTQIAEQAIAGATQRMGQDFRTQVGGMLGQMNSIGALRSGAVPANTNLIMRDFADRAGSYARDAVLPAMEMGQGQASYERESAYRTRADRRARRGGLFRGVGTLLGGGLGFMVGGPAGALAGARIGGGVGGAAGGY